MVDKTSKGSSTDWRPIDKQFATLAVHAGYGGENKNLSALVPPITISATYEVDPPFEDRVSKTFLHYFMRRNVATFDKSIINNKI